MDSTGIIHILFLAKSYDFSNWQHWITSTNDRISAYLYQLTNCINQKRNAYKWLFKVQGSEGFRAITKGWFLIHWHSGGDTHNMLISNWKKNKYFVQILDMPSYLWLWLHKPHSRHFNLFKLNAMGNLMTVRDYRYVKHSFAWQYSNKLNILYFFGKCFCYGKTIIRFLSKQQ